MLIQSMMLPVLESKSVAVNNRYMTLVEAKKERIVQYLLVTGKTETHFL